MGALMYTRLLIAALLLSACSSIPVPQGVFDSPPRPPASGSYVEMNYLGNGGWLVTREGDKIASAPFVTNPNGFSLMFHREPNRALIDDDAVIPPMPGVGMILVGHG